jgi:hypothetical protein
VGGQQFLLSWSGHSHFGSEFWMAFDPQTQLNLFMNSQHLTLTDELPQEPNLTRHGACKLQTVLSNGHSQSWFVKN